MSNEATTAAENQKKFEEQQRYFMQMQKNMMRQNYAQQIMGAFNTISAYKVLKTASQYGMIFPVDYNSKMVLSQKLYQALVLNNTSTDEDEWKTLANSLMMAQQQTMRNMLFSPQMNNGGMNMMGMGMPMMGNQMGMMNMGQMPGMGMNMMGMGMPMMGNQMGMMNMCQMPGMSMNMMGMAQPQAAQVGNDKQNNVNNLKSYVQANLFNTDPVVLISILMNNGLEFDDSDLDRILGQTLANSAYYMDDNSIVYFYQIVVSLYNVSIQQGKDGNAAPNQQNMMGMNMMGMGMPMMGNQMGMMNMCQMPGMGMNMMGMGMPMMGNQMGMMNMGQMRMPGMGNANPSGLNALY